jgi:hypothetical protein
MDRKIVHLIPLFAAHNKEKAFVLLCHCYKSVPLLGWRVDEVFLWLTFAETLPKPKKDWSSDHQRIYK